MEVANLKLTLGNEEREFLFRKGTADEAVVVQALKTAAYDVGRLRRGPELDGLYEGTSKRPLIIDAAADIGAAAVFFAHKFPRSRIIAFEADPAKFQLLRANTANLRVECVQSACTAIGEIYNNQAPEAQPFIVKFDVDADNLFAFDAAWVECTPVLIASLNECLIPGTAGLHKFIKVAADWGRDLFYLDDNVFSVSRNERLMQAAS